MTNQKIIGLMQFFYIAKKGSRIAKYHDKSIEDIAKAFNAEHYSIESSHMNSDGEKFFSIRTFTDESGATGYIAGSQLPLDSEELLSDIQSGLMTSISQEKYLNIYRKLEEE